MARANLYTAYGKTLTAREWFEQPECQSTDNFQTFRQRLKTRPIEVALAPEPRRGRKVTLNGTTRSLVEWAEISGIPLVTICARIERGWDPAEAIFTPNTKPSVEYRAWGESKTFKQWIKDERCKIRSFKLFLKRLNDGLSVEDALSTQPRSVYVGFGEAKTLSEWFDDSRCQVPFSTLCDRVRDGVGIESALTKSSQIYSNTECELAEFVESLGLDIVRNDRTLIKPKELDIYVPSHQLAIEFNGVYWHSEKYVGRAHHYNKWKACKDKGIQLIQVWEDDWRDRTDIVKSMLKHKLGLHENSIYARETEVDVSVDSHEAREFLDLNHIQGSCSGRYYYGLRYSGELVAVMVFAVDSTGIADWTLSRFASTGSVVGGFSKLLKAFKSNHSGFIKSFADLTVSDGNVYEKNGFVFDGLVKPDYSYVMKDKRFHKFLFRKKRFEEDKDLLYDSDLTERQLAELNGLHRVYDAGKIRFILHD